MLGTIKVSKLKALQKMSGENLVTLYVPLEKGSFGHKQNKSQLHAVRSGLKKQLSVEQYALLSRTIDGLIGELGYVNSYEGVFAVLHGMTLEVFALPFRPQLLVYTGASFHLEQLRHYYGNNKSYYVLAISKKGSHLFKGDKASLHHVPVADLEKDMETLLGIDEKVGPELQNHPSGAGGKHGSEGFHGHGGMKDVKKSLYESYLRAVDKKIMKAIKNKRLPLVLVAVGYGQSAYRHVSKYPAIALKSITTNPDDLSTRDLHSKVVPLLF